MNTIIAEAISNKRDYVTPEDVTQAIKNNPGDLHRIRIDMLEILAQQTQFGAEDRALCASVAFEGTEE